MKLFSYLLLLTIFTAFITVNECQFFAMTGYTLNPVNPTTLSTLCTFDIFVKFNGSNVTSSLGYKIYSDSQSTLWKYNCMANVGQGQTGITARENSTASPETFQIYFNCTDVDPSSQFTLSQIQNNTLEFLHDTIYDKIYMVPNLSGMSNRKANLFADKIAPTTTTGYGVFLNRILNNYYYEFKVRVSPPQFIIESQITVTPIPSKTTITINTFPTVYSTNITGATIPQYTTRTVSEISPNLVTISDRPIQDTSLYIVNDQSAIGIRMFPLLSNGVNVSNVGYYPYTMGSGSKTVVASPFPMVGNSKYLAAVSLQDPVSLLSPSGVSALEVTTFGNDKKIYKLAFDFSAYNTFSTQAPFDNGNTYPYFYGFQKFASQKANYKIYLMTTKYSSNLIQGSMFGKSGYSLSFSSIQVVDDVKPVLLDLQITHFNNYQFIVRFRAADAKSGVFKLFMLDQIVTLEDLVDGDQYDGTYEKLINIYEADQMTLKVIVIDRAQNQQAFISGDVLSLQMNSFPDNPMNNIINDVTAISFDQNQVDVTNGFVSNRLYLSISNFTYCSKFPVMFKPKFQYFDSNPLADTPILFTGLYNNQKSRYEVDFQIPGKLMRKVVQYELLVAGVVYTSELLSQLFPTTSVLSVVSQVSDEVPPFIQSIEVQQLPGNSSFITLGYKLLISYDSIQWKSAEISIASSIDPYPRVFSKKFSDTDADGHLYILFPYEIASCVQHTFKLISVRIVDDSGHASYYETYGLVNPPYRFPAFIPPAITIDSITPNCVPGPPSVPPVLVSYAITNKQPNEILDVSIANKLIFKLVVTKINGDIPPISTRNTPQLFLADIQANIIQVPLPTFTNGSQPGEIAFTGETTLPIGFGMEGILVSISNVADTQSNFAYFSPEDLPNGSGYISTVFSNGKPTIYSTTTITTNGGVLTIYGTRFGLDQSKTKVIAQIPGSPSFELPLVSFSSIAIVVYNVPATNQNISIYVVVDSVQSNIKTLVPTYQPPLTPSPVQQQCPGNPVCGGPDNGVCTDSGVCQCKGSWTGPSCLSQQITIPQPNVSTTDPSAETTVNGTLPDGSQISFRNLISVVELRELNFKNEIQRNFTFTQWLFTNTSTSSTTSYLYATSIDNNSTNVTVSVQWYPTETTITFANEEIRMLPSTMKYTIEISSFDFQSSTNRLQLVMNAQTISDNTDKDSCVTRTTNNQQDSDLTYEYFKLQIDNHSLYGRFIKRALVDFRPTAISNTPLNSTTQDNGLLEAQQLIGINIPYFKNKVIIDPDFSVLVENNPIDDSNCPSSSKGLTKSQLAGIIIASSVVGLFVILLSIYIIMKKTNTAVEFRYKLRKLGKISA
ncbi:hypothetical protein DLAC_01244 [Tieghemostelium lacteum]|uniref:EGF-like domain-containing protein n=1 Tax=Tieghemostelium lacteum TaxID=361077 RepID=A0A152A8H5_TIELA|nr:hypothetical protein DLAC_01244 [Tieghemostelium lacteum]|eukprot:KYR02405.1 hypothetical protein DLAC_01244 [Tieghemostelium lacteum]